MANTRTIKRYTPRQAEALLARLVAFSAEPTTSSSQKDALRLLREVLHVGPVLFTSVPAITSWSVRDLASFQRTMQAFFRRMVDVAESGGEESVPVPELVVEQLRIGVTTIRDDIALTVEGHADIDVLIFQIVHLVQKVGPDRLRRCPCGRVFAKTGRREFCSDQCQKRFYMRARRANERKRVRRTRHGKTMRKR